MRRNVLVALVGLGLATAVVPQPARAGLPPTACSTLALQVCAAVSAQSYMDGFDQWHLVLNVWNLFGYSPTSGLSHVITFVGFGSTSFTGTATLAGTSFNGSAITDWVEITKKINNNIVGAELDTAAVGTNGITNGLVGCTQPMPPGKYQTCYPSGASLQLDFATSMQFDLSDPTAVYGWHSQAVNGLANCSLWVSSDGSQTNDSGAGACSTVTPEPVTMVLLGTGLAGMGLAKVRRRKKDGDLESI